MVASEKTTVEQWRLKQLLLLGFTPVEASALAKSDKDVREIEKLIRSGCSPVLAARIV